MKERDKAYLVFTVVILMLLVLFLLRPFHGMTGLLTVDLKEKFVVVLEPAAGEQGGLITGYAVVEMDKRQEENIEAAQKQILDDVNEPILFGILGKRDDVVAEQKLETVPAMIVNANEEGVEKLMEHPLVKAVYQDFPLDLSLDNSVPLIGASNAHNVIVNDVLLRGQNISVCVVDSGINNAHPAFENRIVREKCYCGFSCCPNGQSEDDFANDTHSVTHGTHVSGIIGSNGNYIGVAPSVNLVAVSVCSNLGCLLSDVLSGIDFCVTNKDEHNIKVISLSLGDNGGYNSQGDCPTYLDAAFEAANNSQISIAASSGNNAYNNGINYPACSPAVISVGATNDNDNLASFSNYGALLDIFAPGVSIISTKHDAYGSLSGTSMSAPHVSGAIALLYQYANLTNQILTPQEVREALKNSTVLVLGFPRLNVIDSLQNLGWVNESSMGNEEFLDAEIISPEKDSIIFSENVLLSVDITGNFSNTTNVSTRWHSSISGYLGEGNNIYVNLTDGEQIILANVSAEDENAIDEVFVKAISPACLINFDFNENFLSDIGDDILFLKKIINETLECIDLINDSLFLIDADADGNEIVEINDAQILLKKIINENISNIFENTANNSQIIFTIQPEQQTITAGQTATIQIILDSDSAINGYDIVLNSSLTYYSHNFVLNETLNALTVNDDILRTAMITDAGAAGSKTVIEIIFSTETSGQYEIKGTAKAYDEEGNELDAEVIAATINVIGSEIILQDKITTNKTAMMSICMRNFQEIDEINLELEFDNKKTRLINSTFNFTLTETGANISAEINKTASLECDEIIKLLFDIKSFGEAIPVKIKTAETIPELNFTLTNGSIMQEGYYISCENTTTYKGKNVFVKINLYTTENITSINYTAQTEFDLMQAETTKGAINYTNKSIMQKLNFTNKTFTIAELMYLIPLTAGDGDYEINLTNITADNEKKAERQNKCHIIIETNCTDGDSDGYGVGDQCLTPTTIPGGDCDDTNPDINPGEQEQCNSIDDDCDGSIDEGGICDTDSNSGSLGSGQASGSAAQSSATQAASAEDTSLGFATKFAEKIPQKQEAAQAVQTDEKTAEQKVSSDKESKENLISGLVGADNKISLITGLTGMLVLVGAVLFIVYEVMKRKGKGRKKGEQEN